MSIDLKPCPFCGQQPKVEKWRRGTVIAHRDCPVGVDSFSDDPNGDGFGVYFSDLESAARAWNTRAERTCRIRGGECDQCGAIIHEHANLYWVPVGEGMRTVEHRDVHYCPNCGAKVVD